MEEYRKFDTELNGNFFDFSVPGATFRNALDAYREIYAEVNGDDIEFISGIELNYHSLIPETMTIIDAIAEIEKFCKIYRIFDMKTWENGEGDTIVVNGEVLSFIW